MTIPKILSAAVLGTCLTAIPPGLHKAGTRLHPNCPARSNH